MAALPKSLEIVLEFEPIVKLWCEETLCQNNLMRDAGWYNCNLKHISIGKNGKCLNFKPREQKDEN